MAHPRSLSEPVNDPRPVDDPARPPDPDDLLAGLRPPPPITVSERLARFRYRLPQSPGRSVAAAVALGVVAAAAWWLLRPPTAPVESTLPLASAAGAISGSPAEAAGAGGPAPAGGAATGSTTTVPADEVVVQASGAVARPGVYRLAPGARVDDVVRQAGGLTSDADADRVNLAAPVADGERVWVPRKGETEPPEVVAGTGGGGGSGAGGGTIAGGKPGAGPGTVAVVDLNAATAEQLDTLPGVGPATATAILAYREEQGPFSSVDELLEVRGIGDAKLEQLRPLVRV